MEVNNSDDMERFSDLAGEFLNNLAMEGRLEELRREMERLSKKLPSHLAFAMFLGVDVYDKRRQRSLNYLDTGLACNASEPPYPYDNSPAIQKYLVGGQLVKVPVDYCPSCWGEWLKKFEEPKCPHCNKHMGGDIKLMIDNDVCPNCFDGTISPSQPLCSICGFQATPEIISWG